MSPDYHRWLRYFNATRSDVYMSLSTFKEHARRRTKEDLTEIRYLCLDLDEDGARKLEAIRHDRAVAAPNYVLSTSPGKFQVIWRVEGLGQDQAETPLHDLAARLRRDRRVRRAAFFISVAAANPAGLGLCGAQAQSRRGPESDHSRCAGYRNKDRYDNNDATKLIAPAQARPYYYAEQSVTKAMAHLESRSGRSERKG